jgi:hypothetical protein
MAINLSIPYPIPELQIHLNSCEQVANDGCFYGHDCDTSFWPASFRTGEIVNGYIETNFNENNSNLEFDGLWVILQGVGLVHGTPTPVAAGLEPLAVSGYMSLPGIWQLGQDERIEMYMKAKTSLWKASNGKPFPYKSKLKFKYRLPATDLPQTFFGTHGKVSYWVIAILQGRTPVWTMQRFIMLPNQNINVTHPDQFSEHLAYSDNHLR